MALDLDEIRSQIDNEKFIGSSNIQLTVLIASVPFRLEYSRSEGSVWQVERPSVMEPVTTREGGSLTYFKAINVTATLTVVATSKLARMLSTCTMLSIMRPGKPAIAVPINVLVQLTDHGYTETFINGKILSGDAFYSFDGKEIKDREFTFVFDMFASTSWLPFT